ncbi:MAG: ABC transporter ATP-binding protein [Myxococcaceae bacterium]
MSHVELRNLRVVLGTEPIVRDVTLSLDEGSLHAIVGPSGCGKSTLLRALAGLVPHEGQVVLDGVDVSAVPTERRGVVLVFQDALLFPRMSVLENVVWPAVAAGRPRAPAIAQARQLLEQVRLLDRETRRPEQLSGGERQRVALARALMANPRVLLLDEPLSALDAGLRDELRTLIVELQRARRLTTVLVTHDQREAAAVGDRVSVMARGAVLQTARPRELYDRPASVAVARFLGATNIFDASATAELKAQAVNTTRCCVWPEDVEFGAFPDGFEGRVLDTTFNGTEQRVRLAVGALVLEAWAPRWTPFEPGTRVTARVLPGRLIPLAD